jgi:hypothetical protein
VKKRSVWWAPLWLDYEHKGSPAKVTIRVGMYVARAQLPQPFTACCLQVASGMSASMQTSMMQGLTTRMDTLTQLVDQVVLLTQELEQKVEGGDKEGGGEGSAEGGDGAGGSGGEGEGGEGMAAAGVTEEQGGAGGEGSAGPGAAAAGSSNVSWGGDSDLGRQGSQPRKNSRYTAQVGG